MSLADLLKSARERRGLTLDQLADETKIPSDRLAAFEQEGLRSNGGFYQRAQVRAYAHALRLEDTVVLKAIQDDIGFVPPEPPPTPPPSVERSPIRAVLAMSVPMKLLCITAAAFIGTSLVNRRWAPAPAAHAIGAGETGSVPENSGSAKEQGQVVQDVKSVSTVPAGSLGTAGSEESRTSPAAPAVPPSPASVYPALVVTSNPDGARVTVDGIGWGVTPLTIRYLPEGVKRIRVTTDGYAASERVVEVGPDRTTRVSVQLRPVALHAQPAS